ncbi:VOC family protein [Micromonospora sp. WMMD1102]|uniref:VOC family protein n=1 Tax=Micromonospora sp. WMMD1102 TaxID=3016105 RepID=UPI002415148A|nr:VOC family protein [Micromonospora sp. WMMD1102]MDG4791745.1 VOC family protein [Micromonospora sp. WMMD1102]
MTYGVIMFELPAEDMSRAQTFYRAVFGWESQAVVGLDTVPEPQEQGGQVQRPIIELITAPLDDDGLPMERGVVTGAVIQRRPEITGPVIFIQVDDVNEALQRVEENGGSTVVGCLRVGEVGRAAYATDTEGNVIGLWQEAVPGIRIGLARRR